MIAERPSIRTVDYRSERVASRLFQLSWVPEEDVWLSLERSIRKLVEATPRAVLRAATFQVDAEDHVLRHWLPEFIGIGAGTVAYLAPVDQVWTDYRAMAEAWVDVEPEHAERLANVIVDDHLSHIRMVWTDALGPVRKLPI